LTFKVPMVIVIVDDEIRAIVQGDILNYTFWLKTIGLNVGKDRMWVRGYDENLNLKIGIVEVNKTRLAEIIGLVGVEHEKPHFETLQRTLTSDPNFGSIRLYKPMCYSLSSTTLSNYDVHSQG